MQPYLKKYVESLERMVRTVQRLCAGGPGDVCRFVRADRHFHRFSGVALILASLLSGCQVEDPLTTAEQLAIDRGLIRSYAKAEGLALDSTSTGVYYFIENKDSALVVRPGGYPVTGTWVLLNYTGKTLDDISLGNSGSVPDTFLFKNLMPGFQTGLAKFRKTQKGILLIPSTLAYKAVAFPEKSIPANAVIRIDVTLVDWGLDN